MCAMVRIAAKMDGSKDPAEFLDITMATETWLTGRTMGVAALKVDIENVNIRFFRQWLAQGGDIH
jgi:hypothetical protein